jgi:hypothetical protein
VLCLKNVSKVIRRLLDYGICSYSVIKCNSIDAIVSVIKASLRKLRKRSYCIVSRDFLRLNNYLKYL